MLDRKTLNIIIANYSYCSTSDFYTTLEFNNMKKALQSSKKGKKMLKTKADYEQSFHLKNEKEHLQHVKQTLQKTKWQWANFCIITMHVNVQFKKWFISYKNTGFTIFA